MSDYIFNDYVVVVPVEVEVCVRATDRDVAKETAIEHLERNVLYCGVNDIDIDADGAWIAWADSRGKK